MRVNKLQLFVFAVVFRVSKPFFMTPMQKPIFYERQMHLKAWQENFTQKKILHWLTWSNNTDHMGATQL